MQFLRVRDFLFIREMQRENIWKMGKRKRVKHKRQRLRETNMSIVLYEAGWYLSSPQTYILKVSALMNLPD